MQQPRIAVLGAGANGSAIGADLVLAGHDVTFVEQWPANVEAIRARGIRVELPDRVLETPARIHHLHEVAELRDRFDLVLVLLKAYDTGWGARLIAPLVAPDGLVVGLQNGMALDELTAAVGPRRAMGAVIEVSSAMWRPGVVERHSPHERSWFAVGPLDGVQDDRAERVAEVLRAAGPVEVRADVRSAKWMKLVLNAAELVPSAILDLSIPDAARYPGMHDAMVRIADEAIDAALAAGSVVAPIFGQDPVDALDPYAYVPRLFDKLLTDYVLPHTRSTVLQDWTKGRHSEVEEINGLVVSVLGAAAAPANAAVLELARRIERGETERGVQHAGALLAAIGA